MSTVSLRAPAKLTWTLRVAERRADGYHDIDAEMVSIDLVDTLVLSEHGEGITLVGSSAGFETLSLGPENLVAQALSLCGRSAAVELTKQIPMGGGLGGGSTDAAAILRWAGFTDLAAAGRMGGDVPFCVAGGRARVTGLGEIVDPLEHVDRSVVLLLPPLGVSTPLAYRALDELRSEGRGHHDRNDLTDAALLVAPALGQWMEEFHRVTGEEVALAGSGSTLFVEGTLESLGCAGMDQLTIAGSTARVIGAKTLPAGTDPESPSQD